jgi:N-acetylmuramoyl-L-alanine amidase
MPVDIHIDVTDLDFVARTVMGEAEGEEYEGKVAVAAIIYNRARTPSWWGTTVKDACITAYQFSSWNSNDPRRNKMGEWNLNTNRTFRDCFMAAVDAIDRDPTGGMDSFYAQHVVTPNWLKDWMPVLVIGNHTFVKTKRW